jgi:hypothetical protein
MLNVAPGHIDAGVVVMLPGADGEALIVTLTLTLELSQPVVLLT